MTSFVVNTLKKRFYLVGIGTIGKIKYPLRKLIFQTAENFGLNIVTKKNYLQITKIRYSTVGLKNQS